MILLPPLVITSRLLPGLHIRTNTGESELAELSIEATGLANQWRYYIDLPGNYSLEGEDLYGWGDERKMLATLLSFLTACAEGRAYSRGSVHTSENRDLFPEVVGEWAEQHSDELSMIACELEEEG